MEGETVNAEEIRGRLSKVFARVLNHAGELRDEMKPGDIADWDSVAHVSLVLATEKEFKIKFKGAEIANLASVGDIVQAVQMKG